MNGHLISLICSKSEFEKTYSFLFFKGYPVLRFPSFQKALESEDFYKSRIVIVDSKIRSASFSDLIYSLQQKNHYAQIILAWDFDRIPDSDTLLRLFYCIRKPFTKEKLLDAVERACEKGLQWESRKDVRTPFNMPVDFYFNARIWMTNTTNLSLDGMQAVWPERKLACEVLGRMRREKHPFLTCRMYVDGEKKTPVSVPVSLKYFTEHEENGEYLMGFRFGDLTGNLKNKLYETITV